MGKWQQDSDQNVWVHMSRLFQLSCLVFKKQQFLQRLQRTANVLLVRKHILFFDNFYFFYLKRVRFYQSQPKDQCLSHILSLDDIFLYVCSYTQVKVWKLPESERLQVAISTLSPIVKLPDQDRRVETVEWNPVADDILAVGVGKTVKVYDVAANKEICGTDQDII